MQVYLVARMEVHSRILLVMPSSPVSPKTGRLILSGRDVPLKQQERRNGPGSITNG